MGENERRSNMDISQVIPVLRVRSEHVSSEYHTYNKLKYKAFTKLLTCAINENIKTAELLSDGLFDVD